MRVVAGLFVILASITVPRAAAAQEQRFRITAQRGAIVRAMPTTASQRIDTVARDTVLRVLDAGAWVRVELPNKKIGYIRADLGVLETVPAARSIPVVEPPSSSPEPPKPEPRAPPADPPVVKGVSDSKPAAPVATIKTPGRLGVGIAAVDAFAPSLMYDFSPTITLKGEIDAFAGEFLFAPEVLFRFPRPGSQSDWIFEPYVGGGPALASFAKGFIAMGGTFIKHKKIPPNWRFSAEITFIQLGNNNDRASGAAARGYVHYFFSN